MGTVTEVLPAKLSESGLIILLNSMFEFWWSDPKRPEFFSMKPSLSGLVIEDLLS
jgi:hypothetical protein